MKQWFILALFISFSLFCVEPVTFKTFNIRRQGKESVKPEVRNWSVRRPQTLEVIKENNPDIIGLQEVVVGQQYKDIKNELKDYKSFGEGRGQVWNWWLLQKGGQLFNKKWTDDNEANPIFYNPQKVSLIDSGTFKTNNFSYFKFWGKEGHLPRICTWGKFQQNNGTQFYVFNTHLADESVGARETNLKNIINFINDKKMCALRKSGGDRIDNTDKANIPIFLMGDFNANLTANVQLNPKPEQPLTSILQKNNFVELGTLTNPPHAYKHTHTSWRQGEKPKITDYIFVNAGNAAVKVKTYQVEEFAPEKENASDHFPVSATVTVEK